MEAEDIKKLTGSSDYYNRYDKKNNWDYVAVMAGRAMQSAEFNKIQNILEDKIKSIGNSLYADGTVIEGCSISYDTINKKINADGGKIALDGLVYEVNSATLNMPDNIENIQVGVWKKSKIFTEYDKDGKMLLDPAKGTPQYTMPGAYRVITVAEWGLSSEKLDFPFFPVYGVSGDEQVTQLRDNINPEYLDALARYDNHSNGHYVIEGLKVTALESSENGKQVFSVSEGEAHINGYEAIIPHSVRLVVDEAPNLADVKSEVHVFNGETGGTDTIYVSHTPIEEIKQILITKERTVTLTHGGYAGCTDDLPDTSVFKIVKVNQGSLVSKENTDFVFSSDRLSWSLPGEEPAPYSTYSVTYQYRVNVQPDFWDTKKFTVSGAVKGSFLEVDYAYRMPRIDLIVMYTDRSVGIVRGVAHRYNPVVPATPPDSICLAEVTQIWDGLPKVSNIAIQRVSVEEMNNMKTQIINIYSLLAKNEMRFDAMINAPTSAQGVFVDPLFDDDMRDAGIEQNAVIANQTLQLPIETGVINLNLAKENTLDFAHDIVVNQPINTKNMQVNPYQNFTPVPPKITLNIGSGRVSFGLQLNSTYVTSETRTTTYSGNLRSISVNVTAEGFTPNEEVKIIFDGISVACSPNKCDAQGNYQGAFTIPANVPSGTKLVQLKGNITTASAYFVGSHTITSRVQYNVTHVYVDPLAQTFVLDEPRLISGLDFWLTKKSNVEIRFEIRTVSNGSPTSEVLASCTLKGANLVVNQWNRAIFDTPVFLNSDTKYAVTVLTDSSDVEVSVAELAGYDSSTRQWVRQQPYAPGVLLSSSDASTWTAHQNADLTFRLLAARFTSNEKTINLGRFDLTGVTDVMPLAEVESTGADTNVTFVLKQNNTEIARMQAWQSISLDSVLNGNCDLSVELSGNNKLSPVLGRYPQLLTGKLGSEGVYVSRAFVCGQNKKVMVTTDEFSPHGSNIDVFIETAANVWTKGEASENTELGFGWIQRKRFINCNLGSTRIKIVLTGNAGARPLVQAISAVILNA